ncbi:MAG: hypothetical protein ABW223_13570 [Rariglobus sp.]
MGRTILHTKSSPFHPRPLLGLFPWLLFGTVVTAAFAGFMTVLPWLPGIKDSGMPIAIQIVFAAAGAGMWVFLVPAQIKVLLRETTAVYTIEGDDKFLTIAYHYCGMSGQKRFAWRDIQSIGLESVGIPPAEFIRIDPLKGCWFSFGAFVPKASRHEILREIIRCRKNALLGDSPAPV